MIRTGISVWKTMILAITFSGIALPTEAQSNTADTMRVNLVQLEKRFLDSNLLLLAAHYNVDAQKALIEQARLWDNPVLNTDQVIAAGGKFFPYGKAADGSYNGQYYIQVQQLIKTAGKRNKLISIATTNAKLSELQLQDVLRNLRYQLRTDFYTLRQQLNTRRLYQEQLQQLQVLVNGMEAQWKAGNIAQKELLRIQALVISLQQDLNTLERSIQDTETDLKTILQMKEPGFIQPVTEKLQEIQLNSLAETDLLFETAKKNNPYYQLQQTQTVLQQQNLSYQKALRVPDITLGPNFDRNSNFTPNYVGLGISLPLPLLNKNQGNIKSAEFSIKQQQAISSNAETELKNNISNAAQKLMLLWKQQSGTQRTFYQQYENMFGNVLQSYRQKQIGLLEFLDFFTDYTSAQQRLQQQTLDLQLAKEELNYHSGTDILK